MSVGGGALRADQWCRPLKSANELSTWPDVRLEDVPTEHPVREKALAVAMSALSRLGEKSPLRLLYDALLHDIILRSLQLPIVVPDDFSTLHEAVNAALDGQTILLKKGQHSFVRQVSNPTKVDKRLRIVAEPGAIAYGGLQMGHDSSGVLKGLEVRGHVWVYGGKWDIEDCVLRNRGDVALVVSNVAKVDLRRCLIGGGVKRKASDGIIVSGEGRVHAEACDFQRCCLAAITTAGDGHIALTACALFDNSSCFRVFCPGGKGNAVEAYDCVVRRGGRVWADEHRPVRVAGHRNTIHEEEMGESFWDEGHSVGSWERMSNLPGGLSLLPQPGIAA